MDMKYQLMELLFPLQVFKKFGLERYDPINEEFDPNRHYAVFQVPDSSKPEDHVAVVLKVFDLVYTCTRLLLRLHAFKNYVA